MNNDRQPRDIIYFRAFHRWAKPGHCEIDGTISSLDAYAQVSDVMDAMEWWEHEGYLEENMMTVCNDALSQVLYWREQLRPASRFLSMLTPYSDEWEILKEWDRRS